MFEVRYVDDFNKVHYTIAKNISELEFIKERFAQVDYTFVERQFYMEEYAAKYQKQHRNLCGEVSLVFKAVIDFLKNF